MMRISKAALAILACFIASGAQADWTAKDASGSTITFKNSGTCSSVVCVVQQQPVDSTGAAFGVTGNPFFMSFGTGVTLPAFASTPTVNLGTLNGAATAAKQPALGTAGSASADVITVQGIASMTALKVDGSAVTQPVSGTVTTSPPSNASTNMAQVAGTTTDTNSGTKSAGTIRVVLATDQPALTNKLLVTPDSVALPANQSVNNSQINGVTPLMGNGVTGTGSQRVTIASDNTAFSVNATPTAGTAGGSSTTGNIVANNTTAVVVKASAGTLYSIQMSGIGSAPAYLKLYNATSATCGSGTPVKRLMIPAASTAANGGGSNIDFGAAGVKFGTGITYCVTTGIGDADTTAPAASTFLVNVDYQ
jgi:hypothetical protein